MKPTVSLERNNAGRIHIGVTEFNDAGYGVRSYVLSQQDGHTADDVMQRRFKDLRNLIGEDRAHFFEDLSEYTNARVSELTFDEHAPVPPRAYVPFLDDGDDGQSPRDAKWQMELGYMVATAEIDGLVTRFVWNGAGQIHVQTGNCRPFFDWNVWDHEIGAPSIDFNLDSFEGYVRHRLLQDEDLDVLRDMRTALVGA